MKSGILNFRFTRFWFSSLKRILVFFLYLLLKIAVMTFPIFFAQFISQLQFTTWTSDRILNYLIILLLISFSYMFAHWLYQLMVSANVQKFVYRHTLEEMMLWVRQKQNFFNLHQEGDLIARLTGDVQTIYFTYLIWTGFVSIDLTTGLLYVIYLFYKLGWIALISLGIMCLLACTQWLLIRRQTKAQQQLREAQSKWTQCLLEQTEGFHTLRSFGLEEQRLEAIAPIQERVLKAQDYLSRCKSGPTTVRNLMNSILIVSMTGLALFYPSIDPAVWIEVILLSTNTLWIFLMMDSVFSEYRDLKVAYSRLEPLAIEARKVDAARDRLMDQCSDEATHSDEIPILTSLAIDQLNFEYLPTQISADRQLGERGELSETSWRLTISDISLTPGKLILLTGPSGGGKSTLLDLLSGEWPSATTDICYKDQFARDIHPKLIEGQLARVHQDALIPSGTVRQNLLEANSQATEEEMNQALEQAGFIDGELHSGLDTKIGDRGITLSGGQRQRLQFAQICLQKTRLVLLDDLVSAVDRQTERIIIESLQELLQTRGVILASHRLRIGPLADEIIVLDAGRILERGQHEDLIQHRGWYAQEYLRQHARGRNDSIQE